MIHTDNFVICDLDGCLSDDRWRRPLLPTGSDTDYDQYHQPSGADAVNADCLRAVKANLAFLPSTILLIVTARPEKYNAITADWLDRQGLKDWALLMRPNGDMSPSPELKRRLLDEYFSGLYDVPGLGWARVISAYDDRADVLAAYPLRESDKHLVELPYTPPRKEVPAILYEMARTFRERGKTYGDGYRRMGPVMAQLFPEGVPAELALSTRWYLFETLVAKLVRFASSGLTHTDSIHDAAVYAAMLEAES